MAARAEGLTMLAILNSNENRRYQNLCTIRPIQI